VVFRSGSSQDLAIQLSQLLQDESTVNRYRHLAQNTVSQKYDWETVTDQYEALYQFLAKKSWFLGN